MRTLLITTALLASGATPALAQTTSGPYVGLSAGASFPEDSRNRGALTSDVPATADFPAIPSGTPISWRTKFSTGWNVSGQLGYRLANGFRPELEFAYSEYDVDRHGNLTVGGANIDDVDSAVLTRGPASASNPTVGAVLSTDPGRIKTYGVYANLYYDFNAAGRLQPYVGGGIGAQRVDVDYRPSNVPVADAGQTRFAYQLMAGATYKLTPSFDLFGQYNWRATTDRARVPLELVPADLGVESKQSLLSAGVRFHFGGPR